MLYPPNWLDVVLPLAKSVNILIALHVFLAGAFTCLWAWRRGLHPVACVVAGALFMFCGAHFLHVHAGQLSLLFALAWSPLLLAAVDGWFESKSPGWLLAGMLAVTMQILDGDTQTCFYTAIVAGLYVALCLIGKKRRVSAAIGFAGMYVGAAMLGAVQLLTSYQATSESARRAGVSHEFASTLSFAPENFLTLIVPGLFGDMVNLPYWGRWYLWEMCFYVGVVGLVLAIDGAARGDRKLRRFSVSMVVITVVLALGAHTPLFKVFYHCVPGFDRFRATAKFIMWASLFAVMLAGIGMDRLLRNPQREGRFALILLGAGVVFLVVAGNLRQDSDWWLRVIGMIQNSKDWYRDAGIYQEAGFAQRTASFASINLMIAAGLIVLLAALLFWGGRVRYLVALLAVAEVFAFARHARGTFDLATIGSPKVGALAGDDRMLFMRNGNMAMWAHQQDIWGYAPLALKRYAEFMAFTQGESPDEANQNLRFRKSHPFLRMVRLRYVFVPSGNEDRMSEEKSPMQHLHLIEQCRVVEGRNEIFRAMGETGFDPRQEVILESTPNPAPVLCAEPGTVRLVDSSTDQLTIEADVASPVILLITDAYSTGWRARALPGSSQARYDVMPANYILRAVPLGKGHHRLRLEYLPRALVIGKWMSLVSLVAYVAAVICWLRSKSRPLPSAS